MSAQIDTVALARRITILDEIGVGPLWFRRDTVFAEAPVAASALASEPAVSVSARMPAPAPVPVSAAPSAPTLARPKPVAPMQSPSVDAAWDDGAMHAGMASAPVKTVLTLCTSVNVSNPGRYLFIARASSVQGSEELFDNILLALGMQREAGAQQGDLASLAAQIAAQRPSALIAMGPAVALQLLDAQNTGDDNASFESLRGRMHRLGELPLLVTYDATHLLRDPRDKRKAWDDLCLLTRLQAADVIDPA
jgi:hypothetical protein